jgi:cell division transport system permease protein
MSTALQSVEDRVTIRVFIADGTEQAQIDKLQREISQMDYVSNVTFTSKEDALKEYQETSGANEKVMSQLESNNPLPASLNVDLTDSEQVTDVAESIVVNQTFRAICDMPSNPQESIMYAQETVERLLALTNIIRYVALAVVALLVFVALIFINNTIRLAIMNRRREISIMRLVGASNGFIRGPFLMEGVIQAIIGAALATVCISLLRHFALPVLSTALPWLSIELPGAVYTQIYLIFFVAAIIIGLFGSALAMRRYLKI